MPRRPRVPKYCLHRRTGHARVKIRGKEIWLGRYDSPESLEKYKRLISELKAPYAPPVGEHGKGTIRLTIVEVLRAYLEFAENYYRCSSTLTSIKASLRPLREQYGRTIADEFGPRKLKALRETMVEAGLSRGVINKRIKSIVRMFRWAASEELIPSRVPESLRQVDGLRRGFTSAREAGPVKPVSDSQIEAAIPHLSTVVAGMIRFQRLTGCRPAEVCELRPMDVDRTEGIWIYRPLHHKTEHLGKQRVIAIGPRAQDVLRRFLLRPADSYCFSPVEAMEERRARERAARQTPMSCGNRPGSNRKRHPRRKPGTKYSRDSYRRAVHRACDAAGVPRWSPNRLRHSAATEIRQRFGLEAAQVTLGHAKANITQVYAERDLALAEKVAMEIG